jgi:hypothetical protein
MMGKCMANCPVGYFSRGKHCHKCHKSCASCFGPSPFDCTACPGSNTLTSAGKCAPSCTGTACYPCPLGKYQVGTACYSCPTGCRFCFEGKCMECKYGFAMAASGVCLASR